MTSRGFDFRSPREIAPLTHEPTRVALRCSLPLSDFL